MSGKTRISITKEYLEQEYSEKRKTTTEIAAEIGCSINTVNARLKHFGIELRKSWDRECESLVGRDFNKWHVLKQMPSKRKVTQWLCECECGTQKVIHYGALTSGQRIQCRKCSAFSQRSKEPITRTFWKQIERGAALRNLPIEITREDAYNLFLIQNKKCALTGMDLKFSDTTTSFNGTASLDRKDSSLGYVKGNVQWVHKDINLMKLDHSEDRFVHLCEMVVKYKSLVLEKSHEVSVVPEYVDVDGRNDCPCTTKANI
jgi:hypothetical protein